jgi:hypothetical protein
MTQREQRDLIPAYAGISTGLVSAQIGKYGFWGKKFARQAAKDFKAQAAENRQSATKLQGVVDAIRKNPKRNPLPEHSKITAFMESFKPGTLSTLRSSRGLLRDTGMSRAPC